MVKIISAIGENGEYAYKGKLPWPTSDASKSDMKFFREYTMGKTIIMGYNTWTSIGRLLPGRTNIIIGKDMTLEEALKRHPDAIIIGGVSTIREVLSKHIHLVEEVIINRFRQSFTADTYFDIKSIPMIYQITELEHYTQLRYFWP